MSDELKPCPFCGGGARYVKHSAGIKGTQGFDYWDAAACEACGGTVGACDRRFRQKDDAARAWNRRVSPPADESVQMDASPKFGTKRAAALALYKPPFKFQHGYIFDADGRMVADQDGVDGKVTEHVLARVRGWGYIQYKDKPELRAEELQDEVGAVMAEALSAYWLAAMAKGD